MDTARPFVLAFDTANEVIALGLGKLCPETATVEAVTCAEVEARLASNSPLGPLIDVLFDLSGLVLEFIG